jgi:hypothetical protein
MNEVAADHSDAVAESDEVRMARLAVNQALDVLFRAAVTGDVQVTGDVYVKAVTTVASLFLQVGATNYGKLLANSSVVRLENTAARGVQMDQSNPSLATFDDHVRMLKLAVNEAIDASFQAVITGPMRFTGTLSAVGLVKLLAASGDFLQKGTTTVIDASGNLFAPGGHVEAPTGKGFRIAGALLIQVASGIQQLVGSWNVENDLGADNLYADNGAGGGEIVAAGKVQGSSFAVGATAGVDGTFLSGDGTPKTVTVTKGIITGIV